MSEENKKNEEDVELVMDTSKMTEEQISSMEVAESARETEWTKPSFASKLFMGDFDTSFLYPFPEQNEEDKKIGDEFLVKLEAVLKTVDPEEVDRTGELPEEYRAKLFEVGAFGMKVPKEYGGLGFSQVNYNRAAQLIASYDGATATLISAHQSIGVPNPLKMFGTPEQKKKYFPRLASKSISAFALTEPDVGSDPSKMTTVADPMDDGEHFLINGTKLWCTNGPIADLIVVMTQTKPKVVRGRERKQITAFIVEGTAPGVETLHRCDFMGLRGIYNGLMKFTDVKVHKSDILWAEGRGLALALRTLNAGRLTLPAASAGLAKQCLHMCTKWGKEREQWGRPIGEHEEGRQKLAYIASMTFALDAVTKSTSHWTDQGEADLRIEAAMAKLFSTEVAWKVIDTTMQFRGGRGYERADSLRTRGEDVFPVERAMRDCRINMILEGSSEIMKLFLAREAMDPHIQIAGPMMKASSSFGDKMGAVGKILGFYSTWLPKQYIAPLFVGGHSKMGPLARHYKFVDKASHKLARSFIYYMGMYQDKLEKKQMILGRLVDIGTELFVMSVTCAYAKSMMDKDKTNKEPYKLANHFCELARTRINGFFKDLSCNHDELSNKMADSVIAGNLEWLEEGIIKAGKAERAPLGSE